MKFKHNFSEGPDSPSRTSIQTNPVDAGATALLVVSVIVLMSILIFGMAVLVSKRRKRGNANQDLEYSKLMSKNTCDD